ncbi:MAG: aldolase, partial [Acidobacteriota bacterium]
MVTVKDIEYACDIGQSLDFSRHELEGTELSLQKTFYPYGFAVQVRTNRREVLALLEELWGMFDKQHDSETIQSDVFVADGGSVECPPTPNYQIHLPWMISIADGMNYSIVDLERKRAQISISNAALQHPLYLKYFLLGAPVGCIATSYATPIHAGCVALDGRGVLLCGDSGAGKSSLSFACARKGWTYITDDAAF